MLPFYSSLKKFFFLNRQVKRELTTVTKSSKNTLQRAVFWVVKNLNTIRTQIRWKCDRLCEDVDFTPMIICGLLRSVLSIPRSNKWFRRFLKFFPASYTTYPGADPKQLYDRVPKSPSRRVKKYRCKRFSVLLETENAGGQKRWARGSGVGLVNENNSSANGVSMSLSHGAPKLCLSSYGLDPVVDNKRFLKLVFET